MRALLVCAIAATLALGFAERSGACSMPPSLHPTEPRALVADADAVFTGTLVAVRPKNPGVPYAPAPTIFSFAVEEWIKGDHGDRVEVVSTSVGLGCGGLLPTIGRQGSFLLSHNDGEWGPWAISEIAPELLRDALLPWPKPSGVGRAVFLAGGHFGLIRTALLDSRGRTLVYGYGRGAVTAVSVCPGSKVLAELVRVGESVRLAVRELATLRLLRETELRPHGFGEKLVCRNGDGSDVLAAVVVHGLERPETQLVRITSIGARIVAAGPSLSFTTRDRARPVQPPWGWKAHTTTVGPGGAVFGVDRAGRFLTERNGRVISLGMVFSPAVSVLEPLIGSR